MQNAQDTFYIVLRDRLAAVNPSRTISLRGVVRPGIFVEGNEIVTAQGPPDAFILKWTGLCRDVSLPSVMLQMDCEIAYMTEGSTGNLGLDRHRLLTQMDMEIGSILQPANTQKMSYRQTPALPMQTEIFWSDPIFQPIQTVRDQLSRIATVSIFSYEEPGEL